jgi:hypothetical protein
MFEQENEVLETPQEQVTEQQQNSKEYNFTQMREQKERAERERDEMMRRLDAIEKAQKQQADPEKEWDDDQYTEGRHLSKIKNKFSKDIDDLKSQIKQYEAQAIEARLRSECPDIDNVLANENLETFKKEYPELAETVSANNNFYTKAKATYTMIKKLGINKQDSLREETEMIQKNASRPRASNSTSSQSGQNPLSKANEFAQGLTPELKEKLWREMQESAKKLR